MADRTLTVSTVGQPDKTLTINRDRFAGVRTMTRQDADGSSSTITINRTVAGTKYGDKPGQPRPLLGKVVGGAAAAYSLRDLNDKQGTTKVVEVRRDADNAEKTFKAKDVRTIEDWVNGKLETTLPCDVDTAAAAYSLRKVRNDYTGNAVQIRRASDNVEVNVAFDSNGEVSTSSAITNVVESPDIGDTTATTLGGFLTEESDILDEQNFSSDTGAFLGFGATLTFDNDSVSDGSVSKDDCLEVELTSASNAYVRDTGANLYSGINNVKIRFEADFYAPSTNTSAVSVRLQNTFEEINGGGSQVFFPTTKGAWTSVSVEGYPNQNALQLLVLDRTVGDVYYFANMKISIIGDNGTVVTWYDQSGNGNDATQDTTGSQPKIAEGGSLLDDIDFDGVDDFLLTSQSGSFAQPVSLFQVFSSEASVTSDYQIDAISSIAMLSGSDGSIFYFAGSLLNSTIDFPTSGDALHSVVFSGSSSTVFADGALVATGDVGGGNFNKSFSIGARKTSSQASNISYKEIIFYNSDQSDNRFKIESNINNHYGIYTPAEDGFVETWYDQSGNGRHAKQDAVEGYQPQIVNAGSLTTNDNGNPAIDFDGVDDFFTMDESTNPFDSDGDLSTFIYCDYSTTIVAGQAYAFKFGASSAGTRFGRAYNTNIRIFHHDGTNQAFVQTASAPTGSNLFSSVLDRSANLSFYQNGAVVGTADATVLTGDIDVSPKVIGSGSTAPTANYGAPITELIIYGSDQSANRTAIESNIADEYGITLP